MDLEVTVQAGSRPAAPPDGLDAQLVRPRLRDVATRAGVSLKQASRAINGEYGVAPPTAERVLAAARELGFRPNRVAQSLAGDGRSAVVGLLIPDVADPFVASLVGAVEQVLAAHDLQLITASHRDDPGRQQQLAVAMVDRRVDALLMMSAPGPVDYLAPELLRGLVVVALDRPLEGLATDTVLVDGEAATREVMGRLLHAGHRRIAAVSLDGRPWTVRRRIGAYAAALEAAAIPVDLALIVDEPDPDRAQAALGRILAGEHPPTAVLATSHGAGRVAMRAMRSAGTELDLTVFDSMDDNDLLATPPLVVVASRPHHVGRLGAELAVQRITGLQGPPRQTILPAQVLGRGERSAPETAGPTTFGFEWAAGMAATP